MKISQLCVSEGFSNVYVFLGYRRQMVVWSHIIGISWPGGALAELHPLKAPGHVMLELRLVYK